MSGVGITLELELTNNNKISGPEKVTISQETVSIAWSFVHSPDDTDVVSIVAVDFYTDQKKQCRVDPKYFQHRPTKDAVFKLDVLERDYPKDGATLYYTLIGVAARGGRDGGPVEIELADLDPQLDLEPKSGGAEPPVERKL